MHDWLPQVITDHFSSHWTFSVTPPEVHPNRDELWYTEEKSWVYFDKDFYVHTLIIAILFTLVRHIASSYIFLPLIKWLGSPRSDHPRWLEAFWQIIYYFWMWIFCTSIVLESEYFEDTYRCWADGFPNQILPDTVYWLYSIQLGWYIHCLYAHVFLDPPKKDYWQMFFHHVVAILLIYSAFVKGYWRIGVLVLYSLDGGDILLHYCKMLRLLDNIYFLPNLFKVVMFVPLPVSWFYFRICLYFVKVLINSMYTGVLYAGWQNSHYYFYFNFLLICIWLLQVMWFYYIMLSAWKKIFENKDFDDERDESCPRNNSRANLLRLIQDKDKID